MIRTTWDIEHERLVRHKCHVRGEGSIIAFVSEHQLL